MLSPDQIIKSKNWKSILSDELASELITFDIIYEPFLNTLHLSLIIIKPESRCKGIGSKILQELIQYARKYKLCVVLMPDESYGTQLKYLNNFYRKNGGIIQKNLHFYFE